MTRKYVLPIILLNITVLIFSECSKVDTSRIETEKPSFISFVKSGKSDIFAIPFDRFIQETKNLPIGVFDFGIGGLTVFAEIIKLDRFNNVSHEPGPDSRPRFRE